MSDPMKFRIREATIIEGISPEVTLEQQPNGVQMTVKDKNGTKTALIPKGDSYVLTEADKEQIADAAFESFEAAAEADVRIAEGWAKGTQDDVPVESGSPYYHDNAKYYSEQAADSADDADTAKTEAQTAAASASAAYGTSLLAPNFSTESTYAVGDYVIYSGNLYRCTTAVTTAGAWNNSSWTQVAVGGEVGALKSAINVLDDAVFDEVQSTVYLTPYATAQNCHAYIPNDKFFYGQGYTYANVIVYQIQKDVEYTIKYTAFTGKLDVIATAETYFELPESGYGTGVKYVEKYTAPETGNNQTTLTPSKDGYLYIQLATDQNANTAVSYLGESKVPKTDKIEEDVTEIDNRVKVLEPDASVSDVGKFLKVKTVENGAVSEYEFDNGGSSITIDSELSTISENPVQNKVISSEIENIKEDIYGEPTAVYLNPYAIAEHCHDYIPNDKFFYGQNYNNANVIVYQIEKDVEYTINYTAFTGKLDVIATAETYFAVPDSGYGTGVKYIEKYTASETGNHQTTLTPSKDGYLYLQLETSKSAYTAVSYTKENGLRTGEIDAVARKTAYKVLSNGIALSTKYDSTHDIQYIVNKHGLNELPDFQNTYVFSNDGRSVVHNLDDNNRVIYGNGDWHAPYQIKAVNNINGDSTSGTWFTGGGHGYENASSSASKTARNIGIRYFADGKELYENDEGVAETVLICWTNKIQASNTEKSDGTGREVLKETITMTFRDNVFHSQTVFEPLEDITCLLWYGLQLMYQNGENKTIEYVGGTNRTAYSYSVSSESGDKTANTAKLTNTTTNMVQEFSINPLVDIGKREHCTSNLTKAMFGTTYGKAYATVVNQSTSMGAGEIYVLEGTYKTYKKIMITE